VKEIEELISKGKKTDEEEDAEYGDKSGYEISEELKFKETRLAKIKSAREALEKREQELNPGKGKTIDDKKQISFADKDALIMGKKGNYDYRYNGQISVDSDHQIIVGEHLSKNANDKQEVEAALNEIKETTGSHPERCSIDNGYFSGTNLRALSETEIDVYMATGKGEPLNDEACDLEAKGKLHKSHFTYHSETDTFTCPVGHSLSYPDCLIDVENGPQPLDDLNFSWSFDDGRKRSGMGDAGAVFDLIFQRAGMHKAFLNVSLNPFGLTEVEFGSWFEVPTCYRDSHGDTFWIEEIGGNIQRNPSVESCVRSNGVGMDGEPNPHCCPSDLSVCDEITGHCVEGPTNCGEFEQDLCGSNPFVAVDELDPILEKEGLSCGYSTEYGEECWEYIECKCEWSAGKCLAVSEHLILNETDIWDYDNVSIDGVDVQGICNAGPPTVGGCGFDMSIDDRCEEEGNIYRTWNAAWTGLPPAPTGPAYCTDGSDVIRCAIKLSFFTTASLVAAVVLIVIIYIWLKKKEKGGKRKNRKKIRKNLDIVFIFFKFRINWQRIIA